MAAADRVSSEGERTPFFSVVIPTFNRLGYLKQALDTVFAQRFRSFETIVVDDGSTDGTAEYLGGLANCLTFVRQSNGGPATARNAGAAGARGRYLAFLDSDDLWFPWTLEVYAEVLDRSGNPAFLAGRPAVFVAETEPPAPDYQAPRWQRFADYLAAGDEWRWFSASSFVIARAHFASVGGFSPKLRVGEDADLTLRLGTAPGFVQVKAPATFGYREHASNMWREPHPLFEGASILVQTEQTGGYPGGIARRRERWRILTRQLRPVAIAMLRAGMISRGWALYRSTFAWQLAAGSWRFLLGFPPLAVFYALIRRASPQQ